ncbi:hypothetical protein B0H16DRAFT_1451426 [Mycena metata]|uniref:Lectin n=1 Tax=Mycena metata TaxID=1033252 RepID=A0AAD7JUN8_9AGAR|nr:hypothetical protein B0H16DRAFT_1451426 [Mycena metata]
MILSFLVHAALATAALAQTVPVGVNTTIHDFQGNVFDLADRSTQPFSPVQSLDFKPGEGSPIWVLQPSGTMFTLRNVASNSILITLHNGHNWGTPSGQKSIQLVGGGINGALLLWNITRSVNGVGFKFARYLQYQERYCTWYQGADRRSGAGTGGPERTARDIVPDTTNIRHSKTSADTKNFRTVIRKFETSEFSECHYYHDSHIDRSNFQAPLANLRSKGDTANFHFHQRLIFPVYVRVEGYRRCIIAVIQSQQTVFGEPAY